MGETYTPKLARRPVHSPRIIGNNNSQVSRSPQVGKEIKSDIAVSLTGQVASMSLGDEYMASGDGAINSFSPNPAPVT